MLCVTTPVQNHLVLRYVLRKHVTDKEIKPNGQTDKIRPPVVACTCVYVCVRVCVYVHAYVLTFECLSASVHACMCVCMCACVRVCEHACVCASTRACV